MISARIPAFFTTSHQHNDMQRASLGILPAGSSQEVKAMGEILFLGIAASAGAFKVIAIVVGLIWVVRSLLKQNAVPVDYRHTRY